MARDCKVNLRELGEWTCNVALCEGKNPRNMPTVRAERIVSINKNYRNFQQYLGLDDG